MHYEFVAPSTFLLLVGGLWLRDAGIRMKTGLASAAWVPTQGVSDGGIIGLADRPIAPRAGEPTFTATTLFRYRVDGVEYRGSVVTYKRVFPYLRGAAAIKARDSYPSGAPIPVYFDPKNPSRSVIIPGIGFQNYLSVAMASGVLLLGGLMFTWVLG